MHELTRVESPNLGVMPTSGVIEYFIGNQTTGTARTYLSAIKGFFSWNGGQDYRTVTPFQAMDFDKHLKTTCSPATVQRQIATLKTFYRFAMDCGLVDKNPFAIIKQQGAPSRVSEKFLTESELNKLLDTMKQAGPKRYVLGLLLASLGLRISEAVNLSHNDFLEAPNGKIMVNLLRKGNIRQLVTLRDDIWPIVKTYIGHNPNAFDKRPLFPNPSHGRASAVTLRTWVEDAAKQAEITKKITPHWIRHSTATHLLDQGASLENVAWLLNHANVSTTSRYLHPTDKDISGKMPMKVRTD